MGSLKWSISAFLSGENKYFERSIQRGNALDLNKSFFEKLTIRLTPQYFHHLKSGGRLQLSKFAQEFAEIAVNCKKFAANNDSPVFNIIQLFGPKRKYLQVTEIRYLEFDNMQLLGSKRKWKSAVSVRL